MGKSKFQTSNLAVVKDLCGVLEKHFEAYYMDKVWSPDGKTVTVAFTCERIKP